MQGPVLPHAPLRFTAQQKRPSMGPLVASPRDAIPSRAALQRRDAGARVS
ncbi:hypothetical protein SynA18461_01983 [Synechococcus sp. A18-46.1]|nr:hypothetical protein SynA18461_01983 [Synechococcus sp. A18-46.1]